MTRRTRFASHFKVTSVAAVALAAGAGVITGAARAGALPEVVSPAATGSFKLDEATGSALLRNSRPRAVEICNKTGDVSPQNAASAAPPFIPSGAATLRVYYNGKTEQIQPGECYRMDAGRVRITTDEELSPGDNLQGTIAWVARAHR